MSRVKMIVLRIQSAEGTKRVEVCPSEAVGELYKKVRDVFSFASLGFVLSRDRGFKDEVPAGKAVSVEDLGLQHGDMLFLRPINGTLLREQEQPSTSSTAQTNSQWPDSGSGPSTSSSNPPSSGNPGGAAAPQEDEVDLQLYKIDGKIPRKRDEKFCRHNSNGCCIHCSPLEPYDATHLKEQNIKHMSFHTYLRKLTSGVDRGKFLALEDISCRIKSGCSEHPPWPRGICSKCQPNAVTLNRQTYRHVDNVMFENSDIVERFLDYWRSTGHQRIGFLIGTYERHADVPLGIRARVAAIYEPPQESGRDSVRLLEDDRAASVQQLATQLGLTTVGWIFTDLLSEDAHKGTVQHIRGIESHFLTAQECIMAGHFQNQHPNACKYASSGYFGSKFVTVCVTGDVSKQVHMEGYQVTGQCMALVRDDCLLPTRDAPELGYVRESSDKQYVPDVFYKEKDQYGNEVASAARPLPVEYLLVDVPCAAAGQPLATFSRPRPHHTPFPARAHDLRALALYLAQYQHHEFLEAMSDFHVLVFVASMDALPMQAHMELLLQAVRSGDQELAQCWRTSDSWATVEQLMEHIRPDIDGSDVVGGGGMSGSGGLQDGPLWTCPHCTYHNPPHRDTCEICILPK